ncbi:MAG: magnesium/cobalt transporter CorA [Candidatus Krumholzibacteriota bacterium]|nr:magnesium/cobalt transporter CorA [Candidatus Krumholzibacteriota bacterium]
MPRLFNKTHKKAGLPPGTLVFHGDKKIDKVKISLIDYDENQFQEKKIEKIEDCFPFKDEPTVTWINIDGLHDVEMLEKLGERFDIHPLVLEDIISVGQRPKLDDFDNYIFIVLRMLSYDDKNDELLSEQVSLILGANFVISFQEREGDVFEPIRERLRGKKGRIIKQGADYLAYTLLDIVVDNYFTILEKVGDRMEAMDEVIVENPDPENLQEIQAIKHEMIFIRKSIWPLREVISGLERLESKLIRHSTHIYLRDVYDHTIQVIDTVESLRDMISGLLDIYMSSVSNRMNEVMKVLTIIATIFIPITFIAGIYGMNFESMPELKISWAYPAVWGVIIAVIAGMVVYFKKKKWL